MPSLQPRLCAPSTTVLLVGGLAGALALLRAPDARACGGVFTEPPPPEQQAVTVDAQRIALSLAPSRTVLWSQIRYAGPPGEFAWVLPVPAGATIELSSDAWLDALDTVTGARIMAPGRSCEAESSGCGLGGCGSAAEAGGDLRDGSFDGVEVVSEATIGPYQTATLAGGTGAEVHDWLVGNGYAVPDDVTPVLETYAGLGLQFLALRLSPGATVRQMSPVRVVLPGAFPSVPLGMMLAGAGATVPITLFVLGEGRYEPSSFPMSRVDFSRLAWDYDASTSNYPALRAEALAQGDGGAMIATFARANALSSTIPTGPEGGAASFAADDGSLHETLASLYFAAGGASCGGAAGTLASNGGSIAAACGGEGEPACGALPDGSLPASELACGELTDVAAAVTGMRPRFVWVTRIEADLPRDWLVYDGSYPASLDLTASSNQEPEESWHYASILKNDPCAETAAAATPGPRGPTSAPASIALMLAGALALLGARRWASVAPAAQGS